MSWLRHVPAGLRPLSPARLRRIEHDVADEIGFHLAMCADRFVAEGMTRAEAHDEALRRFGDVDRVAEACARTQTGSSLRLGIRATETFVSLTLGLGLIATVLLIANAVLFRAPAGLQGDARRVAVWWQGPEVGDSFTGSTPEEIRAIRSLDDTFRDVSRARYHRAHVRSGDTAPDFVRVKSVSEEYFRLVGARPLIGRVFRSDEAERPVTVLSHSTWQTRFGADPEVVGRTLEINGRAHTVVGVMPESVTTYLETSLYLPLTAAEVEASTRTILVAARLRPGVTREAAAARVAAALRGRAPMTVRLRPLERVFNEAVQPRLMVELKLAGLLLLALLVHVLCRHLSAPSTPGRKASPARNLLIVVGAGGLALLAAWGAADVLAGPILGRLRHLFDVRPDPRVVSVIAGLATLVGVAACGIGAAARARGVGRRWTVRGLVVVELSVAMILLVALAAPVGMLLRSHGTEPGFEARGLQTIDLAPAATCGDARVRALDRILERTRSMPGVETASLTQAFPMTDRYMPRWIHGDARPDERYLANVAVVDPDYTAVMEIPLVAGRRLNRLGRESGTPAAVINQTLAERIVPGGDPVGTRIVLAEGQRFEIVGVVADVRQTALHRPVEPIVYVPFACCVGWGEITLVLRTTDGSGEVVAGVAAALRDLDPAMPVGEAVSADRIVSASRRGLLFRTFWLALPAGLAILLAMIDVGGLVIDLGRRGLRGVAGLCASGWTIAAAATWILTRADWPALGPWIRLDVPTAGALALLLTLGLISWTSAVAWYTRRFQPITR